jgi:hypothetical protein
MRPKKTVLPTPPPSLGSPHYSFIVLYSVDTAVRHKKGEPKGLKQPQAGRFVNEQVKNYRQKTESDAVPKVPAKPETKQGQDHKTVQEEEMEVAAKQQPQLNSGGIYPNIQAGDDQRERTGSGAGWLSGEGRDWKELY